MKWMAFIWIASAVTALAAPDTISVLRRQVEEQERQIRQLEVENERLRSMLTQSERRVGNPLAGTKVSGRPGEVAARKPDSEEVHIVAKGETLAEIAAEKRVAVDSLVALNGIADPSSIRPGQRLQLPKRTPASSQAANKDARPPDHGGHTVQAGENLFRISLRYGVRLDELLAANPSIDPHRLRIGQQVRIPDNGAELADGR